MGFQGKCRKHSMTALVNVCCVEVLNGVKDDCVEITLKIGMQLSRTTLLRQMKSFGSNCCISKFVSGNVWNLFLFQKVMSAMALVVGTMVPI